MPASLVRVLIVDDDVESTELLSLLLERRGHQVRVAHDVDAALHIALDFKPDVALLDIMIRCESGYFLARELSAMPELKRCRLVAMTGFSQPQHRRASEAAGLHRHLTKPINAAELFDAIEAPPPNAAEG